MKREGEVRRDGGVFEAGMEERRIEGRKSREEGRRVRERLEGERIRKEGIYTRES